LNTGKDIVTLKQISQERVRNTRGITGSEFNPKVDFPSGVVQTWVSTGNELLIYLLFTDISDILGLNSLSFLLRCPFSNRYHQHYGGR